MPDGMQKTQPNWMRAWYEKWLGGGPFGSAIWRPTEWFQKLKPPVYEYAGLGPRTLEVMSRPPSPEVQRMQLFRDAYYDILESMLKYQVASEDLNEEKAKELLARAEMMLGEGRFYGLPLQAEIKGLYPELFEMVAPATPPWSVTYKGKQYTPEQWQAVGRDFWGADINRWQQEYHLAQQQAELDRLISAWRQTQRTLAQPTHIDAGELGTQREKEAYIGEVTGESPLKIRARYAKEGRY